MYYNLNEISRILFIYTDIDISGTKNHFDMVVMYCNLIFEIIWYVLVSKPINLTYNVAWT